jgi:hypothetical protein
VEDKHPITQSTPEAEMHVSNEYAGLRTDFRVNGAAHAVSLLDVELRESILCNHKQQHNRKSFKRRRRRRHLDEDEVRIERKKTL